MTDPTMTGSYDDLQMASDLRNRLRPQCPRCAGLDFFPLTWCDGVIWFLCAGCYKLWQVDIAHADRAHRHEPVHQPASAAVTRPEGNAA
jgi:hypothetical protein